MLDFKVIDAHVHLLDPKRLAYGWLAETPALRRAWTADDFMRTAKPYEVEGFVFVEVDVDSPQRGEEADWIDGLARVDKRIKGAVVSLPLEQGAALEPEIARVAALNSVRGVRRLLQDEADPEFALRPHFLAALKLLPKYKLAFDVCVRHPQLGSVIEMARRCPEVSFVLDHLGKPDVKSGLAEPWRAEIAELAKLPNVACKLSGLITEADHGAWTPAQLRPYVDWVWERFGVERVLYGGDWPVVTLAGDYLQWLVTLEQATADFSEGERRNLFRDNAVRVYRLGR